MGDIIEFCKNTVKKPAQQIGKVYKEQLESREEAEEDDEYVPNIDISLGPDSIEEHVEEETEHRKKVRRAKQKLLNAEVSDEAAQDEEDSAPVQARLDDLFEDKNEEQDEEKEQKPQVKSETSTYSDGIEKRVYTYPPLTLLSAPKISRKSESDSEIQQNAEILMDTLSSFGVKTRLLGASRGPAVTRYELQPSAGVRISKITQLSNDIALNLAATKVRIEAPIPNKAAVGIEVPNSVVSSVTLREILSSTTFKSSENDLEVALGKDIAGNIITTDLAKMPHVLIAGTTGSGKSVCTNSMIISLLYKSSPADVRLLLIDPKMVEFNIYNGIPHLLIPVVTDPKKAAGALGWAVSEMENRYRLFAEHKVKDITSYNKLAETSDELHKLPKVVIIIDEFADLMMTAPGDVESAVCRLAQKARAAGMHLVIATQRPSVNVITGLIKANITSRIALTVSSQIDSRTIIDGSGAESLLGRGDMLLKLYGSDKLTRVQGCFVSEKEIADVVSYVKNNEAAEYDQQVIDEIEKLAVKDSKGASPAGDEGSNDEGGEVDPLLRDAIEVVIDNGQASTSLLQRKLKVGYARAARLIDEMEERGIVSGYEGSKPRKVLITRDQWVEMNMRESE
ncbi:MAG: DNA translocase FtsK [Ruminococcaceae bacterium]|nr:DNA translocase FtsK [Oscillospiraceae bacterium]